MSTDLTLRNLDEGLVSRLEAEAKRRGIKVDTVVAQTLAENFPQTSGASQFLLRDVSGLAGVWTESDAEEFHRAINDLETVDEELWK